MLTNLTKTQRAVLVCVVERHAGGWLPSEVLFKYVPRGRVPSYQLRLFGMLFFRRRGEKRSWKPTRLGILVYRGIKAEGGAL
jgi:hypothetical protein